MAEITKSKTGPSFTTSIVIALLLGLLCGLLFGEYTNWIKWVGDAFVGLLQMAVLPYVAVSLITNVGRLSFSSSLRLLRISVSVLILLWLVGLVALLIMTQAFPDWESGSFFSSRFTEEPPAHDWLDLFVPSNPFRSLVDNSIPAVVVFCIGIGLGLMGLPNKEKLLEPLDILVAALAKLNKLVVRLTPIGMFAIVAQASGTIDFMQFSLIQGYLLTYAAAVVILSFVVVPALVAALTPVKFTEVVKASRDPLITAFVIGNTFVILPMIIDAIRKLYEDYNVVSGELYQEPDYLVPLAYPFPDVGRIVGLIFIPFAAWFYGTAIELDRYPTFLGVGILGSFGKPVITIPLLLDITELPSDIFNLFLASGVVAARFGDLMKSMHLIAFTILTGVFVGGFGEIKWKKLLAGWAVSALLLFLAAITIRGYLNASFKDTFSREKLVTEREMVFPSDRPSAVVPVSIADPGEPRPNAEPIREGQSRVERIRQQGCIRIGFDPGRMPFAYYNSRQQLVGFDIEMAYYLANDLAVDRPIRIEFLPIDSRIPLHEQLRDDHFDIAMSAIEGTVNQAALLPAIDPYMEVILAIVVPDHDKGKYKTRDDILAIPNLKLCVIKGSFFAERAARISADIELIELESANEYFDNRNLNANGLVISAESGSAWTLLRPEYSVANPLEGRIRVPLYYLTAADQEFESFLQNWLTLKRSDGTYQRLYEHWILGEENQSQSRRWYILRDVLHWVD